MNMDGQGIHIYLQKEIQQQFLCFHILHATTYIWQADVVEDSTFQPECGSEYALVKTTWPALPEQ